MSVYTAVERHELEAFLDLHSVGRLVAYEGISDGIENTNYFVTTDDSEYVLTLFEELSAAELPYFLSLMAFLAEHNVPSAHPIADRSGQYLGVLNGKPAALVRRLAGHSVTRPNVRQCRAVGENLGCLHREGKAFREHRNNERGPHWWRVTIDQLLPKLNPDEAARLEREIHYQAGFRAGHLPRGVIHADLFRDNALFEGDKLTGIIDFYYACDDVLLYDLAITVNDWCSLPDGSLEHTKAAALLQAYHGQRPLLSEEQPAWPVVLRAAALRFWLSRLKDLHFPRPGEITHTKDPDVFKRILLQRETQGETLQELWV